MRARGSVPETPDTDVENELLVSTFHLPVPHSVDIWAYSIGKSEGAARSRMDDGILTHSTTQHSNCLSTFRLPSPSPKQVSIASSTPAKTETFQVVFLPGATTLGRELLYHWIRKRSIMMPRMKAAWYHRLDICCCCWFGEQESLIQ